MTEKTARRVLWVVAGGFVIFNAVLFLVLFFGKSPAAPPAKSTDTTAPATTTAPAANLR